MDIPIGQPTAAINFADVAVELRLAELVLPEMSYAALLETAVRLVRAQNVELVAARIGLGPEVSRRIITDARRRIDLLGAAHLTFKALIPHEAMLRPLLIADAAWRAKFTGA